MENGKAFKSDSFSGIVSQLKSYRLNNNIPVGDPEQEVLQFYAKNWPYMVEIDYDSKPAVEHQDYASWRDWVFKTWDKPPKSMIVTKVATLRWEVCEKCPHNKKIDWKETDEMANIKRRVFMLRRAMDVPKNLGYCSCHRTDLSVFTLIEAAKEFSAKKDTESEYAACWVK